MKIPKPVKKIIAYVLFVIGCVCISAVIVTELRQQRAARFSQELLDSMRVVAETQQALQETQQEATPEPTVAPTAPPTATPSPTPATEPDPTLVANPYQDSFLANEDMVGWLQIPDTNIDYPVMWTPVDEDYYLYRAFDGSDDNNGSLILDTDSCVDPLSTNLIIHGHNMKSGAMFGNLNNYESEQYAQTHSLITLYTEELQRNYQVIAVFRSQVYRKSDQVFKFYQFFQADTKEEFNDFYENIKALSLYDTGVTAEFGDHFLTLTTCTYHVEQGRFVVVAKEVEEGSQYEPFRQEN